jgi:hypothetical protein
MPDCVSIKRCWILSPRTACTCRNRGYQL